MGHSRLPVARGVVHVKVFKSLGWIHDRTNGSHFILRQDGQRATLSVPCHKGRDLARGTLSKLIAASGLSEDEYIEAFKKHS